RGNGDASDQMWSDPRHHAKVAVDELLDLWPLHLDNDFLARHERRGVDLCDGRGGKRFALDGGEDSVQRLKQVLFDDTPDDAERLGRHLIAALAELHYEGLREDSLAGRDDLTELDVRRSEPFRGDAQPA